MEYLIRRKRCRIFAEERQKRCGVGEKAMARESTTRASSRNSAYYFTVSHPQCGVRELCAKTDNRRKQWIAKINEISNELERNGSVYGKLLKQGGLKKNIWQERWCVCAGNTLDYFEVATDNQSKGTIELLNATVREFVQKDKFCFEVSAATAGKKGLKKYVFAFEREGEKSRWMEGLRKATQPATMRNEGGSLNGAQSSNPLHVPNDPDTMSTQSFAELSSISLEKQISGYLLKKSPNAMVGWQKRFFKMQPNGDIHYFKTEADSLKENSESRGVIVLQDLQLEGDVEVNSKTFELLLRTKGKDYQLKAATMEDARNWAEAIEAAVLANIAK